MTDEAAESRGPATTGAGPSQDSPAPSATPADPAPAAPGAAARPRNDATVEFEAAATPVPHAPEDEAADPTLRIERAGEPGDPDTGADRTLEFSSPDEQNPDRVVGVDETREFDAASAPAAEPAPATEAADRKIGPEDEVPAAWTPPTGNAPLADEPPTDAATDPTAAASASPGGPPSPEAAAEAAPLPPDTGTPPPPPPPPPPPGAGTTPPGAGTTPPGAGTTPPWFGGTDGPTFNREHLVRPRNGRYVAGVCAAIGRATNTDPVLWRVVLAVLGLFGGVGVLIYLVGWLTVPGEGDTASPIESLLGRGRSSMSPMSVVLLGGAAVLTFAFVVNDGVRAALIAGALLVGATLVLRRNAQRRTPDGPGQPVAEPEAAFAAAPQAPPPPPSYAPPPPPYAPPAGGYRAPFAPHGPYASATPPPPPPPFQAAPPPPKAPKPPKERSKLGRITFFAVLLVIGVLALSSAAGASIPASAYFAAALATVAAGLIVGAWLGRARGLIFLAVLATFGLAASTGTERFGDQVGSNVYRPATLAAVADRYDFTVGDATLDLRQVDFAGAKQEISVDMKLGQLTVLLPPDVDTTAVVGMDRGRADVFGRSWGGNDLGQETVDDLGADGAGGGTLALNLKVDTGEVTVKR